MKRDYRKPLVIAAPKAGLRYPKAKSTLQEFQTGTKFQPVIEDKIGDEVKAVVFCSGFIYHKLMAQLDGARPDILVARVEELAPFPMQQVQSVLTKYGSNKKVVWLQDESMNAGAYQWALPHIQRAMRREGYSNQDVKYIGRDSVHTISVGNAHGFKKEEAHIAEQIDQFLGSL